MVASSWRTRQCRLQAAEATTQTVPSPPGREVHTTALYGDRSRPGPGGWRTSSTTRHGDRAPPSPRRQAQCTLSACRRERTVELVVVGAPVVPILDVLVPQMVSGEVADVLGPCLAGTWEQLPQAQVLEAAAGVHQDLSHLEQTRRRTAGEVAHAYRQLYSNPCEAGGSHGGRASLGLHFEGHPLGRYISTGHHCCCREAVTLGRRGSQCSRSRSHPSSKSGCYWMLCRSFCS